MNSNKKAKSRSDDKLLRKKLISVLCGCFGKKKQKKDK